MTTATADKAKAKPKAEYPPEFEVEFGNADKNWNFMLPYFERRVRGTYSMRNVRRNVGDMTGLPDHPGERLHIIPRKQAFHLYDPLKDDPDRCREINRVLRGKVISMPEYNPAVHKFPESKQVDVDPDRLKTIILLVCRLHQEGNCKVTKGRLPTPEEIEAMPGLELYDPHSKNRYKPKYAKDGADFEWRISTQPIY